MHIYIPHSSHHNYEACGFSLSLVSKRLHLFLKTNIVVHYGNKSVKKITSHPANYQFIITHFKVISGIFLTNKNVTEFKNEGVYLMGKKVMY